MNRAQVIDWTDENIALMKELHAAGKSSGIIAARLKGSRNAVIGKLSRLRLNTGKRPEYKLASRATHRGFGVKIIRQRGLQPRIKVVAAPSLKPTAAPFNPVGVAILALKESSCRWPLGDPTTAEFRYCGEARADEHRPYCAYHCRIAYIPIRGRAA